MKKRIEIDILYPCTLKVPFEKLFFCGCSSVVERHVANVNVVSSSLITRYMDLGRCKRSKTWKINLLLNY